MKNAVLISESKTSISVALTCIQDSFFTHLQQYRELLNALMLLNYVTYGIFLLLFEKKNCNMCCMKCQLGVKEENTAMAGT